MAATMMNSLTQSRGRPRFWGRLTAATLGIGGLLLLGAAPARMPGALATNDWILFWFRPPAEPVTQWWTFFAWWWWPFDRTVVLLDGPHSGGVCDKDVARNAFTSSSFGSLMVDDFGPETAECPTEIAAFSARGAMQLHEHPTWSTATSGDVRLVVLDRRLAVRLNIWVESGATGGVARATTERDAAAAWFRQNRAGLKLEGTVQQTAQSLGTGCHAVAAIKAFGAPIYDPAAMNAYFIAGTVQQFVSESFSLPKAGYNCRLEGAPNIMFVSAATFLPTTLAHELGHGFSLDHVGSEYSYGAGMATSLQGGFTTTNLMFDGLLATTTEDRNYLSLGQVYRLNVHDASWLNTTDGIVTPVRAGRPRKTCEPLVTDPAGRCPAQNQQWP